MDAMRKQLRNWIGRTMGPPTPSGYGIPTHLPTPKSLMNAKIPRRNLSKLHTKTRKWSKENEGANSQGLKWPHSPFTSTSFLAQKNS